MANFKSILIIALASFGMVSFNPVMAQNPTRSTLDFWLTFGELLTEDVVDSLSQFTLPSLPNIPLPNIQFPPINIPIPVPTFPTFPVPIPIPGLACSGTPGTAATTTAAPSVTPTPPTSPQQQQLAIYLYYLYQLYPSLFAQAPPKPTQPAQVTPAPATPAPATASPPAACDGCKPDKVRIVVVDDCDEKKSSESCEDSDEVVVVPRGRFNRKLRPNGF